MAMMSLRIMAVRNHKMVRTTTITVIDNTTKRCS